jgi:hypothetical protein
MKNILHAIFSTRVIPGVMTLVVVLCVVSAATAVSATFAPLTIRVVNNSGSDIQHLYLAPANTDNWGSDELGGTPISPGVTRTLNVSWDHPSIKLVGEDRDGCFLTTTVEASGELEWNINADSPRNCGN